MADIEREVERHVNRISREVGSYKQRLTELIRQLDVDGITRQQEQRIISEINALLNELDAKLVEESGTTIADVYERSRGEVLVALGVFASTGAAIRYLRSDETSLSRTHRAFLRSETQILTDDLLSATQNTRRRVKRTIRQVAAEQLREGTGVRQQSREIRADVRRRLGDSANFAIRDAANRRWKLDHYVATVVKTKLSQTHVEATVNETIEQGAGHVVVSRHASACPKCKPWEGRTLQIDSSVEGDEPTLDDARAGGLFHPTCGHTITPIRK